MASSPKQMHGMFNWAACATTDLSAAESFYGSLFGWESERATTEYGNVYSVQRLHGHRAAVLYLLNDKPDGSSVGPHWETYIEVGNVEETVDNVDLAGGKIVLNPFIEPGVGKIAVIQDSVGASLLIWHSDPGYGSQIFHQPGAITWNELSTNDTKKAAEFYNRVFGLEPVIMEDGTSYTVLKKGNQPVAGILKTTPEMGNIPSTWDVYFASDDVDAVSKSVVAAGGTAIRDPFDIPDVGARMAVLQDPQGAVFEVIHSAEQDV